MRVSLKVFLLGIIFITFHFNVIAQKKSKDSKNSKLVLQLADKYYKNTEYYLAAKEYAKVLESNPQNKYATFMSAESYRLFFDYKNAEDFYKKTIDMDQSGEYQLSQFWYGIMLKLNGKYDEAQEHLQNFIDNDKGEIQDIQAYKERAKIELNGCKLALIELKKPQKDYTFENLKSPVNSGVSDYAPVIYENDSSVVIASSRKESKGEKEYGALGGEFSDNYRFVKEEGGWAQMHDKDLFSGLHTELNESPGSFTNDKKKFYFTRCDKVVKMEGVSVHECAIYVSENKEDKWQKPVMLNENINMKDQWNAQPNVTADGDTLFFVSKRPGGYGLHDIWMSTSTGKDDWGPAINLGDKINTAFIDMSPCYYPKENTLFFASEGHEGFGGLDVFIAKGEKFSEVKNAGLPFNSNRDDFYFVLGEKKGYLSSNREEGSGNDDVYWFDIKAKVCVIAAINKDSLQDAKSISVIGTLKVKETDLPASDLEILLRNANGELLKKTTTDETGLFRLENLTPENYKVLLEDFDPRLTFEVKYIVERVQVKKSLQASSRTLFENIYFDFDKYDLRPEAKKVLDELVAYYNANPDLQIEMKANTDAFGTNEYNEKLSEARGRVSLDYLIAKGVKKSSLVINAKGEGAPIATNNNPAGRQLNRRVEFYIVGGPGYQAKAMAYVIEPKITLYSVAKKFNMTLDELKQLNDLKNNSITAYAPLRVRRINDEDIIAPATISFVKEAPATDFPDTEIKNESNIEKTEAKEKPKQLTKTEFPAAEEIKSGKKDRKSGMKTYSPKLNEGEEIFTVPPTYTLYTIAQMYGMTVEDLKQLNGLKSNNLHVGQKLKVIKSAIIRDDPSKLYTVKDGETMFIIAGKFGLTVDELKQLNNLTSDVLYENMILRIKK